MKTIDFADQFRILIASYIDEGAKINSIAIKTRDVLERNVGKTKNSHRRAVRGDGTCESPNQRQIEWTPIKVAAVILMACALIRFGNVMMENDFDYHEIKMYIKGSECIRSSAELITEMVRPELDCGFCTGMKSVDVVRSVGKEEFLEKYAYTNVPVLVKGAAKNWSAIKVYSYEFFKDLYTSIPGSMERVEQDCQFFPYATEFTMFHEVFNMSDSRAGNEPGEKTWYIGWCDSQTKAERELKKYYNRPNFLPHLRNSSDVDPVDWIFMGWPGKGAPIHIDMVSAPSWQAQVRGVKTWKLIPSVECDGLCHDLNATMEPGDILIVDTNKWFHSTYIHPGDMSISVGSEY